MYSVVRTWYYVRMPKVTIWIRNEDMPNWLAIPNKPEWLHNSLNGLIIPNWKKAKLPLYEPPSSVWSEDSEPKYEPMED